MRDDAAAADAFAACAWRRPTQDARAVHAHSLRPHDARNGQAPARADRANDPALIDTHTSIQPLAHALDPLERQQRLGCLQPVRRRVPRQSRCARR